MIMVLERVGRLGSMAHWVTHPTLHFCLIVDVHAQVELDIARFLGVESAIIYAQAFSTTSSVIPDFSKRGDIIVAYAYVLRRLIVEIKGLILLFKRVCRYLDQQFDGSSIMTWMILSKFWRKLMWNNCEERNL
jgi:hypothetical protein